MIDLPPNLVAMLGGAETANLLYKLHIKALASDGVEVDLPGARTFTWKPTELAYRDAAGNFDYLVGSSPASLSYDGNVARFIRTFPAGDDVFRAEATRVKHWVVLQEPPRAPAEYLGAGQEFGVSGLVGGIPFPVGSHEVLTSGDVVLPRPVARDLEGKEVLGRYEVLDTDGRQQLFIWFPASFLADAVFPIMIDPTTVVSAAYSTAGNGGRKEVKLSNGWLIQAAYDSAGPRLVFYKSTDGGTTWTQLTYWSYSGVDFALASNGTTVYALITTSTAIAISVFDATTVGASIVSTSNPDSGQTAIDTCSLTNVGTTLHAAWASKNATYPNSLNIRYSKSTDGGTTWAAPTQLTTINTSGRDMLHPWIGILSTNPLILWADKDSAPQYSIRSIVYNGASWNGPVYVYNGAAYFQDSPCGVVESTGHIVAFWHGKDSTDSAKHNLRAAESTDSGNIYGASTKLTTGNTYDQTVPTAGIDPATDNIYLKFQGRGSGSYDQIRQINRISGVWGSITDVTAYTTGHATNPASMEKAVDAIIGFAWMNGQDSRVDFDKVTLNVAPNAPTGLTRVNFDATADAAFSWTFSDPDSGNTQGSYQLQIVRVSDGVTVKDTGKVASGSASYTLPAAAIANGQQYQWKVKTWDNSDAAGPWSGLASFYASAKPTAAITNPATDGAVVTGSSLTASWSYSDPESEAQSAYQVKLTDASDGILWDSGKVAGTALSRTIGMDLVNTTNYKVKVTVWDAKDIQSAEAVRTFSTNFTVPAVPTLAVAGDGSHGRIQVQITNPAPGAGEPTVTNNDLSRRKLGTASWTRIATGIPAGGTYLDYGVASGQTYEYKATAHGDNGTIRDSLSASGSMTLACVWLHDVTDPEGSAYRFAYDSERSQGWKPEGQLAKYAGRTRPVALFGQNDEGRVRARLQMRAGNQDYQKLMGLVQRKTTLCYRDHRGRLVYGVILDLPVDDANYGTVTTIEVVETSYSEAV